MDVLIAMVVCVGFVAVCWLVLDARRQRRRSLAMAQPFPDAWAAILRTTLPPYAKLPEELRNELHRDINLFMAEKAFEGCGGLELNDEIRITIAAQACMLLLNRADGCYPRLRSILVYPSTYVAGGKGVLGGDGDEESVRLGESWSSGVVVLAWDSARRGASNFDDGHNVVMHEFAHQLDQEDGPADGAPILGRHSAYASWAKVFSSEFAALQSKTRRGKRSVFDSYGATNPAEFFAVATESFFEKPQRFRKKHPELYAELQAYYKVDPGNWD